MPNQPLSYESPQQAGMSRHDIGSLAFKLLGLYCIVVGLPNFGLFLAYVLTTGQWRWGWSDMTIALVYVTIYGGMAAVFLLGADWFSAKLFASRHPGEPSKAMPRDLQAIAFSVVGVLLIVWALPSLIFNLAENASRGTSLGLASALQHLAQCALGIGLFVGGNALARLWHRIRTPRYREE
jgi:hypothetical protein